MANNTSVPSIKLKNWELNLISLFKASPLSGSVLCLPSTMGKTQQSVLLPELGETIIDEIFQELCET